MEAHYKYVDKNGIFEDLLGQAEYFFKTVQKVAPQLLADTKSYENELLTILTDTTFRKNVFTDWDVVFILYNLPIDDYVDLLSSVVPLYKNKAINQEIFELFIFQDICITSSIYRNYENKKLQAFLNKLLDDNDLILQAELENKNFRKRILRLKSGATWWGSDSKDEIGMKRFSEVQIPALDTLKIEH